MRTPIPIVIDTDVGADPDDAIALALALASPDVDVRGVTTVDGDVDLRARMAARLLGMAGRPEVPVVRGASVRGTQMMGLEGRGLLDHDWDGPEARILDTSAPQWLVETAKRERVHLVALGPLTNVAAACRLDSGFAGRLLGLTVMGGVYDETALPEPWQRAIRERGPDAWPDYNTYVDPLGALVAARAGADVTWVTSEVTHGIPLSRRGRERFDEGGPLGRALGRMVDSWYEGWFRENMVEGDNIAALPADTVSLLHDPLTLASLLPERDDWLTLRTVRLRYAIEGGLFRMYGAGREGEATARVAVSAEAERFAAFCVDRVVRRAAEVNVSTSDGHDE
jgi:inosine-uridine nucleoside N-ribohydrolase